MYNNPYGAIWQCSRIKFDSDYLVPKCIVGKCIKTYDRSSSPTLCRFNACPHCKSQSHSCSHWTSQSQSGSAEPAFLRETQQWMLGKAVLETERERNESCDCVISDLVFVTLNNKTTSNIIDQIFLNKRYTDNTEEFFILLSLLLFAILIAYFL